MLECPLDQKEAGEHDHEEWGLSPEAIAAGERAQVMLGDAAQDIAEGG